MQLDGIHHVTCVTGDAPGNVHFYTAVMGLRLVAKSVNQDDPTVYHLFYADEHGDPGSDITFFEYPGAARGRAGQGMVHRVVWRVASPEAIDFWEQRLADLRVESRRDGDVLIFADPEGLEHELIVSTVDAPLIAEHPEIPPGLPSDLLQRRPDLNRTVRHLWLHPSPRQGIAASPELLQRLRAE